MSLEKTTEKSTVKQPIAYGRIELRIRSTYLETYKENDEFSRVCIDVPCRDIGINKIAQNLRDELEMKGISRDIAGKSCDAMVEILNNEILLEVLREMVIAERDIKI